MADYLVWREAFSVGYPPIDDQHKQIIGIINAAFELTRTGGSVEKLDGILADLQHYTVTHFGYEEQILKIVNYGDTSGHRLAHAKMAKKTAEFCVGKRYSLGILSADILAFLKEWWSSHILVMDAEYAPFLKSLAAAEQAHRHNRENQA